MSATLLLSIAVGTTLAMGLANFGLRALRNFSRRSLEEICRSRGNVDRFGEILRMHEPVALGVELLSSVLGGIAVTSGIVWANERWHIDGAASLVQLLWASSIAALILLLARTCGPWTAERLFSETFLYATWPFWKGASVCASPLIWIVHMADAVAHRLLGRSRPLSADSQELEEELRSIVNEGRRGGDLEDDALEMIEGVMDLGDAVVYQIMTPRTDMHMVNVNTPWDEVVADVIESGHTRTPVYDSSRDDIVGILYSKDLLPELATTNSENRSSLRDLLRKPLFVPETKRVDDLLQMFQQSRTHIALVLDEYGGVAGLVTIEDVLEEIVGEIVDEYDPEHVEDLARIDDDVFEALGRAHIDDINHAMNVELPEDGDFDTIAGFVFTALGRIPQVGETVVWQDKVRVQVLETSRRRIERVRVERLTGVSQENPQ